MTGMTYARFFPSDWRSGCFTLNLEEEGLYIRCCAFMYDTGKPVPGDDKAASRTLNVQIQKYQKVMQSLINKGKMIRAQGTIINERVFDEIDKYRREKAARSEAAAKREAERKARLEKEIGKAVKAVVKGEQPPHQPPHQPGGGCLGGTPKEPHDVPEGVIEEKPNEINGAHSTAVPQADHDCGTNPESRIQNKKEETSSKEEVVADATPSPADDETTPLKALEAFQAYNELAQRVGLPTARTLTPQRRKNLMARLREHGGMEAWHRVLANVENSAFLKGKNARGWRADFDFLVQASRFAKVIDGVYGERKQEAGASTESEIERMTRIMSETDGIGVHT